MMPISHCGFHYRGIALGIARMAPDLHGQQAATLFICLELMYVCNRYAEAIGSESLQSPKGWT